MTPRDEEWLLFWASLLSPVLQGDVAARGVNDFLHTLAKKEKLLPNGRLGKVSVWTLRRKIKALRAGGLEALVRKRRADRGLPRAHQADRVKRAIELKRDQLDRSDRALNKILAVEFKAPLARSTLYRHLKLAGATRKKLRGTKTKKVRCRWTRNHTHALWVGDFENGPYVLFEGNAVPTFLAVWIDCHSRFIVEARYYYAQSFDILIDSLLRAWATHGTPEGLYVDNAKVFHARALRLACCSLHIRLRFRPARDPPAGGIIERAIQTIQGQVEAEVRAGDILILPELNRSLMAWLDIAYHRDVHSETKQPPRERYQQGLKAIRHVQDMEAVARYFMRRETRTVHRDFSDVQIQNRFYRVDPSLRGDRVEVRYDPFDARLETVLIYSAQGDYRGTGARHNRERRSDTPAPPPQPKPTFNYLNFLVQQHEEELQARGIDFRRVVTPRRWPFASFVKTFASLLGRPGGFAAFSAREIEAMQKCYNSILRLTRPLLEEAVAAASEKTVLAVLFHLRQLSRRKE